jgi:hypothetical protein
MTAGLRVVLPASSFILPGITRYRGSARSDRDGRRVRFSNAQPAEGSWHKYTYGVALRGCVANGVVAGGLPKVALLPGYAR